MNAKVPAQILFTPSLVCHVCCSYGEYYEEMREFHLQLPKILKPSGVYSYFNGLASDNFFFHMVYGRWGHGYVAA